MRRPSAYPFVSAANALGRWQVTLQDLADDVYSLYAKASDAAGNASAASLTRVVTVDTLPPDVTGVWVDPPVVRRGGHSLNIYARAQDAATGVAQVWAAWLRPQGGYSG